MGYSGWSDSYYRAREDHRARTGESAFRYDEEIRTHPGAEIKCHKLMNPFKIVRESRDSETHPESLAIMVGFDETGSMKAIPRIFQKKLGKLMRLLLDKNIIEHPQTLFFAFGDATIDDVPVQIGQFESGIEMDDDLGRMFLEGGGGPYGQESYELPIYFAARKTSIDCFEKRGKKGYLILSGDELPYGCVSRGLVKKIFGDDLGQDIPIKEIIAEAREKYDIFFIIPTSASGGMNAEVWKRWVNLLGQEYVFILENPEMISETIASIIAANEEKLDIEDGERGLMDLGLGKDEAGAVLKAIIPLANTKSLTKKAVASATLPVAGNKKRSRRL